MFMPLNVSTLSLSWYISYNVLVLDNVTAADSNNSCYEMKYCELSLCSICLDSVRFSPLSLLQLISLIPILTNLITT